MSSLATVALFAGLLVAPATIASAHPEPGVAHLFIGTQPIDTDAGQGFGVTVEVHDAAGDLDTVSTDSITLTLDNGTFSDLSTTATSSAVGGSASFSLQIDTAGSYTLSAHDDDQTLDDVVSDPFDIVPADPDHIEFSAQPSDTTAGQAIGDVVIDVEDGFGNVVTDAVGTISLGIDDGPGALISAPGPQALSGGSATFSGLVINTAGLYSLGASTDIVGLDPVGSDAFTISPDEPADLVFDTGIIDELPVSSATNEHPIAPAVIVTMHDQFGNVVTAAGYDGTEVSVAPTSGSLGAGATSSALTSAGIASFDDLSFDGEGTYALNASATAPALSSTVASEPIEVTPHADLGVTLAASPDGIGDEVVAGTNETFTATVTNHGPSENTSYEVDFTVTPDVAGNAPAGVGGCDPCTSSAGASGGTDSQFVEVAIPPFYTDGGSLGGQADITSTIPTQDPDNDFQDTDTVLLTVVRQADLELSGSFTDPVTAGTDGTLSLSVDNLGPSDNAGYTITTPLPAGTSFVSSPSCTFSSGPDEVTCQNMAGLGASAVPDTYSIVLHVSPSFTNPDVTSMLTILPAISASTDQGANSGDDDPAVSATVDSLADLTLTQDVTVNDATSFDPLVPGNRNTVDVDWVVTNDGGPSDALEVVLEATLPAELIVDTVTDGGASCSSSTTTVSCDAGTLGPDESVEISATAKVDPGLRNGPYTESISSSVSSITPDPDEAGPTDADDATFSTVPDAPVVVSADPGNNQIAVVWTPGSVAPPTDNGGSVITSYDIVIDPSSGPTTSVNVGLGTLVGSLRTATIAASNSNSYAVTVEARNAAGDSSPSNAILDVAPCPTCVLKTVSSTQAVTLNTGSAAAGVTCPQTGVGATGSGTGTFVSCYQFPVNSPKAGLPLALNEGPTDPGDCGADECIGELGVNANPAGEGTGVTIKEFIWVDRTITTDVFGHPCSQNPCDTANGVYAYEVFVNGTLIGTSVKKTWCKTAVPAGKTACVQTLTELTPSNAPNGKAGKGDLQIVVLLKGDPRTTLSG